MTASSSPLLAAAQAAQSARVPAPPLLQTGDVDQKFSKALDAALQAQATISNSSATTAAPVQGAATVDAKARALSAAQLDNPTAPGGAGDVVLNGLQKLRGVFDQQLFSFARSTVNGASTEGLYRAQVAATNFSMFIDVGSKLAGKATQAFETLLKGQ